MSGRIKVFRYIPQLDAFDVTDEYRAAANDLGLSEWNPVVWIGRLFVMDNDHGEHWFDNWDLRREHSAEAEALGLDADTLLFVDPDRFADNRDGPCHDAAFRKRFWTSVLQSLELDMELLFDEARAFNEETRRAVEADPRDSDARSSFRPDLEDRVAHWSRTSQLE